VRGSRWISSAAWRFSKLQIRSHNYHYRACASHLCGPFLWGLPGMARAMETRVASRSARANRKTGTSRCFIIISRFLVRFVRNRPGTPSPGGSSIRRMERAGGMPSPGSDPGFQLLPPFASSTSAHVGVMATFCLWRAVRCLCQLRPPRLSTPIGTINSSEYWEMTYAIRLCCLGSEIVGCFSEARANHVPGHSTSQLAPRESAQGQVSVARCPLHTF
jgi:hypothetical protein